MCLTSSGEATAPTLDTAVVTTRAHPPTAIPFRKNPQGTYELSVAHSCCGSARTEKDVAPASRTRWVWRRRSRTQKVSRRIANAAVNATASVISGYTTGTIIAPQSKRLNCQSTSRLIPKLAERSNSFIAQQREGIAVHRRLSPLKKT